MKEWFNLQIRLYQQLKKEIVQALGTQPKRLAAYEKHFLNDLRHLKPSTTRKLERSLNHSELCLFGDFHSLRQSQRLLNRLLRNPKINTPRQIYFEVLPAELEKPLRDYLNKPSAQKEKKLQLLLKLEENWASSWLVYKDLFQQAHRQGIELKGLNSQKSGLSQRDREMSKILAACKTPSWALVGEFHCARPHLPKLILQANSTLKLCIVQQNEDRLFLRHLKEMKLGRDLIFEAAHKKAEARLFCILHTPIWLKWQSYLNHHIRNLELETQNLDATEQISWSLKQLTEFFDDPRYPRLPHPAQMMDYSFLQTEEETFAIALNKLSSSQQRKILNQLQYQSLAFDFDARKLFFSEVTVNSCAHAAAGLMYRHWSEHDFNTSRNYGLIFAEAIIFFLSKILNHSRKTNTWREWKNIRKAHPDYRRAQKVLRQQEFFLHYQPKTLSDTETCVLLGRCLAEGLFEAFLAGEFSKARLLRHLSTRHQDNKSFFLAVNELHSVSLTFMG